MTPSTETKPQDLPVQGRLLSIREVQKMLNVGASTFFRIQANKKDRIPSVMIGGSRKFQLEKLLWWIEKHEE